MLGLQRKSGILHKAPHHQMVKLALISNSYPRSMRRHILVFEIIFCMIHRFYSFLQAILHFAKLPACARGRSPLFDRCHHHRVGREERTDGRTDGDALQLTSRDSSVGGRNCFRDDYDVEIVCPSVPAPRGFLLRPFLPPTFVRRSTATLRSQRMETLYRWPSSKVNK